jgi:hypothetical protein
MFAVLNTVLKGLRSAKSGSIAAAGTNQATATLVTSGVQKVTAADGTKGVILPALGAADIGSVAFLLNASGLTLKVYPATGGTINEGSANDNVVQEEESLGFYLLTAADTWYAGSLPLIRPANLA